MYRFAAQLRLLSLLAWLAALPLTGCGNVYKSPPPQPPPGLSILYGVDADFRSLYTLDTRLGVHTLVGSPGAGRLEAPAGMAIRPVDGEVFVYNNGEEQDFRRQWGLLQLDRCTGFARRVGPASLPRRTMGALAFASDGQLYGFGQAQAEDNGFYTLYRIDQHSGDYSPVGAVEHGARYSVTAADFHPDGDLYGIGTLVTQGADIQVLMIVDTSSGAASIIGEISPGIRLISSIAFKPSGKLLGIGTSAIGDRILFEIDTASAEVTAVLRSTVAATGMGFAPPRSC